ncbi:hypothetical protein LSAT2_012059 [Lamellibrachia satsuma]|nr:hypothetical protein LSAT2_012059 [Lamellibrachia satsuma]
MPSNTTRLWRAVVSINCLSTAPDHLRRQEALRTATDDDGVGAREPHASSSTTWSATRPEPIVACLDAESRPRCRETTSIVLRRSFSYSAANRALVRQALLKDTPVLWSV